jgi:hypothetical protein
MADFGKTEKSSRLIPVAQSAIGRYCPLTSGVQVAYAHGLRLIRLDAEPAKVGIDACAAGEGDFHFHRVCLLILLSK